MKDDASELRIAIGRVLERWQLERAGLDPESSEQQREAFEMLSRHIEDLKRAVTPATPARAARVAHVRALLERFGGE
jgi:hypothetical protein